MKALKFLAVAAAVLAVSQAQASLTFISGSNYTINYASTAAQTGGVNLAATITYSLANLNVGSNQATFSITATNNTLNQAGTNRLTAFGIGVITPSLTNVADNSGTFDTTINTNFPGFQQVAFCAYAGSTCPGGAGAAAGSLAEAGGTVTFTATMTFSQALTSAGITFASPFTVKFQSVGANERSYELAGCAVGDTGCAPRDPRQIPEPGSLALAGLAIIGLAAAGRRRKA